MEGVDVEREPGTKHQGGQKQDEHKRSAAIAEIDDEREEDGDEPPLLMNLKQTFLLDDLQVQLTKAQLQGLEQKRVNLDMCSEVEQLKLENEELRRKFHAAMLLGKVEERSVVHFLQRDPRSSKLTDEIMKVKDQIKRCDGEVSNHFDDPLVLTMQIESLTQLMNQAKEDYLVEIYALKTTLELTIEERELMKEQYSIRTKEVVEKLEEVKARLHKMMVESLKLKKKLIKVEEKQKQDREKLDAQLAEVGGFCVDLDSNDLIDWGSKTKQKGNLKLTTPPLSQLAEKLSRAENTILEKENLIKEYEIKFLQMERQVKRSREKEETTKVTVAQVIKRLKSKSSLMEDRFEKLDSRRKTDSEGFHTDVQTLKNLIKTIERKVHVFMNRKAMEFSAADAAAAADADSADVAEKAQTAPTGICFDTRRPMSPPQRDDVENLHSKRQPCAGAIPRRDAAPTVRPPIGAKVVEGIRNVKPAGVLSLRNCNLQQKKKAATSGSTQSMENPPNSKDLSPADERRIMREEFERDKVIYDLLCQLLDCARVKVVQMEKNLFNHFV